MTQEKVAAAVGYDRTSIVRIEKDHVGLLTEQLIERLNKLFGGKEWQRDAEREVLKTGGLNAVEIQRLIDRIDTIEIRVHALERERAFGLELHRARKS